MAEVATIGWEQARYMIVLVKATGADIFYFFTYADTKPSSHYSCFRNLQVMIIGYIRECLVSINHFQV